MLSSNHDGKEHRLLVKTIFILRDRRISITDLTIVGILHSRIREAPPQPRVSTTPDISRVDRLKRYRG